ncbi:MAG: hypothetical protein HY271_11945 [Deltaproteobacteria bacterium]|nr:hypothetical protein [Deltaproteobacteria bacterium]
MPSSTGHAERALVAVAGAASLALNLATATRIPIPWLDEVMFTDPAANLLLGRGFTSCAWRFQACDAFWAGYPPLYSTLLFGWMRIFGFGPLAVRSLDYVLVVVAVLALWLAVARLDLVPARRARLWLVALLLLGYGMVFCYRSARVDCLGMALVAAIVLAHTVRPIALRCGMIALLALLLPLTGLQLLVYAGLLGGLLAVRHGRALRHELASGAAGLLGGMGALYGLYTTAGVWPSFVKESLGTASIAGRGLAATLQHYDRNLGGVLKDPSFLVLLVVALTLSARQRSHGEPLARSPLGFALVVAVVIPAVLFLSGVYPVYYSWMTYVPLSIGVCSEKRRFAHAGLVLACAVGLPLVLAWSAVDWADRDYRRLEAALHDAIAADDRVFLDYPAYYFVKPRAAAVFTDRSLKHMTPAQAASIDVLIVSRAQLDEVTPVLGGRWRATGTGIHSRPGRDTRVSIWGPRYDLEVYRRARDG